MHYTQEQIDSANHTDLYWFLRTQGERLEKCGREYRWERHDSVTIDGNKWFQHSRNHGGYPIEFLQTFYGKTFQEAIAILLDERMPNLNDCCMKRPELILPKKADSNDAIYHYLVEERGIKKEVVDFFTENGNLYEDAVHHNVVFVGRDPGGVAKYASVRSTQGCFRQDIAGSDKAYAFHYVGTGLKLAVFEAPIDLMSFACLVDDWREYSLLALGGVSTKGLRQFLTDYPDTEEVLICLDNDEAGQLASYRLADEIPMRMTVRQLIPRLKDWNEVLLAPSEEEPPYTSGFYRDALPPELRSKGMLSLSDIPCLKHPDGSDCGYIDSESYEPLFRMENEAGQSPTSESDCLQSPSVPSACQRQVMGENDMIAHDAQIKQDAMEENGSSAKTRIPVTMICLNDVSQQLVNWLWYPYLPLGKLTAMIGNPGEGKTYTMMNIIAACTNRKLLPSMEEPMEPFNVIYQTAEDGLGDTVKPRLLTAGADLSRVFSIDDTHDLLTLSDERVERAITENKVKLCVFDPIQAFLGAHVDLSPIPCLWQALGTLGKSDDLLSLVGASPLPL